MGDPRTPEGKAQLERQSPLSASSKIRTPLLVMQGANDPRVKKAESVQIVIARRGPGAAHRESRCARRDGRPEGGRDGRHHEIVESGGDWLITDRMKSPTGESVDTVVLEKGTLICPHHPETRDHPRALDSRSGDRGE